MMRGDNDCSNVVPVFCQEMLQGIQIIPGKFVNMGGVFRDFPPCTLITPWIYSVVGVFDFEDLFSLGMFSGDLYGPCRHVRAVFSKYGPLSKVDQLS